MFDNLSIFVLPSDEVLKTSSFEYLNELHNIGLQRRKTLLLVKKVRSQILEFSRLDPDLICNLETIDKASFEIGLASIELDDDVGLLRLECSDISVAVQRIYQLKSEIETILGSLKSN